MKHQKLTLSIALGMAVALGLLFGLNAVSTPVQAAPSAPTIDHSEAINDALAYLETQQLPSGAFPGWTGEADEFTTIKVVFALAADHRPVSSLTISDTTTLDYLKTQSYSYTRNVTGTFPGRIGMLAAAAVAGNEDPYSFGGMNIVNELTSTYHSATGAYSTTASAAGAVNQWWSIIGLAAAQEQVPVTATNYLLGLQEADGGWGYGFGGDVDATAYALQALLASGNVQPTDSQVQDGFEFLSAQQNEQGGWGYWWGPDYFPSADSTAAVIQALVAAGYTPATESWAVASGKNPHANLAAFQAPDGSFSSNAMGTAHAIAGLAEAPLPILGAEGMAHRSLSWLAEQQNVEGGFGNASATAEIVIAFGAAGVDAHTVKSGEGKSPVDFLITQVPTYNNDGGEMGKMILAAVASGKDPHNFGGYDLVFSLTQHISPTGQLGTSMYPRQALGILGLTAAGEEVPPTATQWLTKGQLSSGGWSWSGDPPAGTDTTAQAIQALIAAGEPPTSTSVVSAVNYLRSIQGEDAGFCNSPTYGTDSNTDSTAAAIQALLAAGEDLADWTKNGRTPLETLRHFQKSDGAFVYQWGGWGGPVDNMMSTYHAVPALLGRPHPVVPQVPDDGDNHAGVVIDYGDGTYETACVAFSEPSITGHELMTRTGIPYETTSFVWGDMLTAIREVSATGDAYWSYWYRDPVTGTWQSYPVGFDDSEITDGDVDGWHLVPGWPGSEPGLNLTLGAICGLDSFAPVYLGPDPDRMVAAPMRAMWGSSVDVVVPFGSDLDEDGSVDLAWREEGATNWTAVDSGDVHRADGYFTATLPLTRPVGYEFQVEFTDSEDGVQFGSEMSGTVEMTPVTLEPHTIYLPLVVRNS